MACSCHQTPCHCGGSPCAPANVAHQGACTDPGSATYASHILGLDQQFCQRRLLPGTGGYLIARQTGGGGWRYEFTTAPHVVLGNFTATQGVEFGKLLVQGADDTMRTLTGPPTALLVLQTLASGAVVFAPIPAATVPDPLSVTNLSATTFNLGSGVVTGGLQFASLATGVPAFQLGVDANGNVIQSTPATTGTQSVMFYEAPSSPGGAVTPNATATAGSLLTIGNEISGSLPAGTLVSATNSQTLSIVQGGYFQIDYCAQVVSVANNTITPSIQLLINGIVVNNGNSRPAVTTSTPNRQSMACVGFDERRLTAANTIQLQVANGSGANLAVYEARVRLTRIGA